MKVKDLWEEICDLEEANMDADAVVMQLTGSKSGGQGLSRLKAMMGAKDFAKDNNAFQFKFKGSKKANSVRIILNSGDTYDVEFYKIAGVDFDKVKAFKDVDAENLRGVFTKFTGLDTSL
jgi:hypothetical protein